MDPVAFMVPLLVAVFVAMAVWVWQEGQASERWAGGIRAGAAYAMGYTVALPKRSAPDLPADATSWQRCASLGKSGGTGLGIAWHGRARPRVTPVTPVPVPALAQRTLPRRAPGWRYDCANHGLVWSDGGEPHGPEPCLRNCCRPDFMGGPRVTRTYQGTPAPTMYFRGDGLSEEIVVVDGHARLDWR